MSLNQMNEQFNDALQTYYPKFGKMWGFCYAVATSLLLRFIRWRKKWFGGRILMNERIIEYPQVLRWIRPAGTVLDIGCVSSRLPLQLASLGYEVYGVDIDDYPLTHQNFHFFRHDVFRWSPPVQFDIVILLSTIEHMGLGAYGELKRDRADHELVGRICSWMKPGGQILVSVPFGRPGLTRKHRIYGFSQLQELFPSFHFQWVDQCYFMRVGGNWVPSSAEALREIESPSLPVNGVAVLNLEYRP